MKKIIGIVPATDPIDPEKYNMSDKYHLGNNYIKRAYEAGCTPIGLTPADNWIGEDVLNMCDGFLVQGGNYYYPYHFQVIHHAITHGKRYLGVCLGHQMIYTYLELKRRGILVRHFKDLPDYVRITIGTRADMDALLDATRRILKGEAQ